MVDSMDKKQEIKKNKHLVCYVPLKGTAWKGTFTIPNIHPGQYKEDPFTKKQYIPVEWIVKLSPGDGVVLDDDVYGYYTNPNLSMALSDMVIKHTLIKPNDELYNHEHGDIIEGSFKVDTSVYSIPAMIGSEDFPLTPYKTI